MSESEAEFPFDEVESPTLAALQEFDFARNDLDDTLADLLLDKPDISQFKQNLEDKLEATAKSFGSLARTILTHSEKEESVHAITELWREDDNRRAQMLRAMFETDDFDEMETDDLKDAVRWLAENCDDYDEFEQELEYAYGTFLTNDLNKFVDYLGGEDDSDSISELDDVGHKYELVITMDMKGLLGAIALGSAVVGATAVSLFSKWRRS